MKYTWNGAEVEVLDGQRKFAEDELSELLAFARASKKIDMDRAAAATVEPLIGVEEAMKMLQISQTMLYNMRKRHEIPCIKIGAKVFFKRSDIREWLESKRG